MGSMMPWGSGSVEGGGEEGEFQMMRGEWNMECLHDVFSLQIWPNFFFLLLLLLYCEDNCKLGLHSYGYTFGKSNPICYF